MSKRIIELGVIPTLEQSYKGGYFSPRNIRKSANIAPKYAHKEEFNKKISLIQADITKLKLDAIVNAANETLLGGGGVDGAIHRAAGSGLRNECWDLNGCDTGDAKITKGYDLPSKYVIHTVGPVGEKPHLLRSAYERSMQVMAENNLKSIAFSNISTGVYGYPRWKAGHVALDTMRRWLEQNTDYLDKIDRIIFCVFEDDNKDVYETLFPLYFPFPTKISNEDEEVGQRIGKENEKENENRGQVISHETSTSGLENAKESAVHQDGEEKENNAMENENNVESHNAGIDQKDNEKNTNQNEAASIDLENHTDNNIDKVKDNKEANEDMLGTEEKECTRGISEHQKEVKEENKEQADEETEIKQDNDENSADREGDIKMPDADNEQENCTGSEQLEEGSTDVAMMRDEKNTEQDNGNQSALKRESSPKTTAFTSDKKQMTTTNDENEEVDVSETNDKNTPINDTGDENSSKTHL